MGVEAVSQTPKGNAQGARGGGVSPTIVCGDPLHDQLALQRKVSAASPDASCLIADHKDILQRLSLKPRVAEEVPVAPVLSELEEVHHPLLKSAVEDLQATVSKQMDQDPTGAAALSCLLYTSPSPRD